MAETKRDLKKFVLDLSKIKGRHTELVSVYVPVGYDLNKIIKDLQHKPVEITSDDGIITGPPTLTRFEKARIMGARALQLSLGAPIFIEIPKNATTSLEIAMEELKQRVIPIVIKRTLPNGDYQNIPIDQFA